MAIGIPDDFATSVVSLDAPYVKAIAVTPSDSADLPFIPRGIYVGGAGALSLLLVDGTTTVIFAAVPAGTTIRIRCNRVRTTGGGATSIVALA